jgi:hypothetical protein
MEFDSRKRQDIFLFFKKYKSAEAEPVTYAMCTRDPFQGIEGVRK